MPPHSRREFLQFSGASLAALLLPRPLIQLESGNVPAIPAQEKTARVTIQAIYRYQEPDFTSERLGTIKRDALVPILEEVIAEQGPSYNRRWYRLDDGYIHSAYTQRVETAHLNAVLPLLPPGGQLGELTIAFADSLRLLRNSRWQPLWRIYFGSIHWITHLVSGPDDQPWYGLTDELLHVQYYVPAAAVRPIHPDELAPLSTHIPAESKHIAVSLTNQTFTAYEGEQVVRQGQISSGVHTKNLPPDVLPTDTPSGQFHIQVKVPSKHMGDGQLTSEISAYELLGVPWVSFFHKDGIAFHGTYWHDNFGRKMSHGCINMRNEDAKWLYRWSAPSAGPTDQVSKGWGTRVRIEE